MTINSGATFTFVDTGTGTLTVGTVFTVINNTSASPIAGTFSNLADGSIFTSNGNNFQASYTGGTGNDLTLTVVPGLVSRFPCIGCETGNEGKPNRKRNDVSVSSLQKTGNRLEENFGNEETRRDPLVSIPRLI